ncbi:MAG: hypothetical protein GTO40_06540 [Deltaproteobacteria bacterium]|nr:hypothetical protein [Deltaproteobacteria bacterium]
MVKEHPFFTVPGANGIYQIGDIPMGRYRLEVWHPDVGTKVEAFNMVRDGEIINIDVRLLRNQ